MIQRFANPLLVLLLFALTVPVAGQGQKPRLGYDSFAKHGRDFRPAHAEPIWSWAPDGVHLQGRVDGSRVFVDPASGDRVAPAVVREGARSAPELAEAFAAAIGKALGGKKVSASDIEGRKVQSTLPRTPDPKPQLSATPDDRHAVAVYENQIWAFTMGEEARRVLADASGIRQLRLAPSGTRASFLRGHDLFVLETRDGTVHAVSEDGSEDLFYGELDWVYQEEVYGRYDFQGAWWADTGEHLAFLSIDETEVGTFTVVDHVPNPRTLPENNSALGLLELKYPKAGTANPEASLHVFDARSGKRTALDLSRYPAEEEILIVRVGWTPKGDRVVFQVQDREQTWLDLVTGDPRTGETTVLFRETPDAWAGERGSWVNILLDEPRWLDDGGFLWKSERTGYAHVYRYAADGDLVGALTEGDWQVREITHVDEEKGLLHFEGTEGGAIDRNHYVVGLDGEGFRRLTQGPGTHEIEWNVERTHFIDMVTAVDAPGVQNLVSAEGEILRTLEEYPHVAAVEKFGLELPELHEIPCEDGYVLDATVLKPQGFDPEKSYPVFLQTYSGPDHPTVKNEYGANLTGLYGIWHQFLSQEGYVVLQVNVRSASGRGQKHTATCYRQFGIQELEDLESAVDWLTAEPWADAERVAISGWSYGGFMAGLALAKSDHFKLGIAGAGVYDWRLYDTIYTERYMRTPQNNPEGYAKTSVIGAVGGISDDEHLLVIHGTTDDNVHLQNAVQLSYALQSAGRGFVPGKSFELMLYPKTRHGIRNLQQVFHWRKLVWDTVREHL